MRRRYLDVMRPYCNVTPAHRDLLLLLLKPEFNDQSFSTIKRTRIIQSYIMYFVVKRSARNRFGCISVETRSNRLQLFPSNPLLFFNMTPKMINIYIYT